MLIQVLMDYYMIDLNRPEPPQAAQAPPQESTSVSPEKPRTKLIRHGKW